jgi:hypothetical protein
MKMIWCYGIKRVFCNASISAAECFRLSRQSRLDLTNSICRQEETFLPIHGIPSSITTSKPSSFCVIPLPTDVATSCPPIDYRKFCRSHCSFVFDNASYVYVDLISLLFCLHFYHLVAGLSSHKTNMYTIQRWITLLVLLLALVSVNVLAEEGEKIYEDGGVVEDIQEAAEAVVENVEHVYENIAEAVHVEEVQHVVEDVVEEVAAVSESMKESTVKAAKSLVDSIKTKVSSAVDRIVAESKSVMERCKKMNKADVKKVAAAAVGIWGVAVGVGYLTKGTAPPPPPSSTGKMFAKKK